MRSTSTEPPANGCPPPPPLGAGVAPKPLLLPRRVARHSPSPSPSLGSPTRPSFSLAGPSSSSSRSATTTTSANEMHAATRRPPQPAKTSTLRSTRAGQRGRIAYSRSAPCAPRRPPSSTLDAPDEAYDDAGPGVGGEGGEGGDVAQDGRTSPAPSEYDDAPEDGSVPFDSSALLSSTPHPSTVEGDDAATANNETESEADFFDAASEQADDLDDFDDATYRPAGEGLVEVDEAELALDEDALEAVLDYPATISLPPGVPEPLRPLSAASSSTSPSEYAVAPSPPSSDEDDVLTPQPNIGRFYVPPLPPPRTTTFAQHAVRTYSHSVSVASVPNTTTPQTPGSRPHSKSVSAAGTPPMTPPPALPLPKLPSSLGLAPRMPLPNVLGAASEERGVREWEGGVREVVEEKVVEDASPTLGRAENFEASYLPDLDEEPETSAMQRPPSAASSPRRPRILSSAGASQYYPRRPSRPTPPSDSLPPLPDVGEEPPRHHRFSGPEPRDGEDRRPSLVPVSSIDFDAVVFGPEPITAARSNRSGSVATNRRPRSAGTDDDEASHPYAVAAGPLRKKGVALLEPPAELAPPRRPSDAQTVVPPQRPRRPPPERLLARVPSFASSRHLLAAAVETRPRSQAGACESPLLPWSTSPRNSISAFPMPPSTASAEQQQQPSTPPKPAVPTEPSRAREAVALDLELERLERTRSPASPLQHGGDPKPRFTAAELAVLARSLASPAQIAQANPKRPQSSASAKSSTRKAGAMATPPSSLESTASGSPSEAEGAGGGVRAMRALSAASTASTGSPARHDSFRWSISTASTALTGVSGSPAVSVGGPANGGEKQAAVAQAPPQPAVQVVDAPAGDGEDNKDEVARHDPSQENREVEQDDAVPELVSQAKPGLASEPASVSPQLLIGVVPPLGPDFPSYAEFEVPTTYASFVMGEAASQSRRTLKNSPSSSPEAVAKRRSGSAASGSPRIGHRSARDSPAASISAASDESRWTTYANQFLGSQGLSGHVRLAPSSSAPSGLLQPPVGSPTRTSFAANRGGQTVGRASRPEMLRSHSSQSRPGTPSSFRGPGDSPLSRSKSFSSPSFKSFKRAFGLGAKKAKAGNDSVPDLPSSLSRSTLVDLQRSASISTRGDVEEESTDLSLDRTANDSGWSPKRSVMSTRDSLASSNLSSSQHSSSSSPRHRRVRKLDLPDSPAVPPRGSSTSKSNRALYASSRGSLDALRTSQSATQ